MEKSFLNLAREAAIGNLQAIYELNDILEENEIERIPFCVRLNFCFLSNSRFYVPYDVGYFCDDFDTIIDTYFMLFPSEKETSSFIHNAGSTSTLFIYNRDSKDDLIYSIYLHILDHDFDIMPPEVRPNNTMIFTQHCLESSFATNNSFPNGYIESIRKLNEWCFKHIENKDTLVTTSLYPGIELYNYFPDNPRY